MSGSPPSVDVITGLLFLAPPCKPMPTNVLRLAIQSQTFLSGFVETRLSPSFRVDGVKAFHESISANHLKGHAVVCDVGGGKHPTIDPAKKLSLSLKVVGLDIDRHELANAPTGAYDDVICADICAYRGDENFDLVISNSVLEHVKSGADAMRGIASLLKPGGRAVLLVPCRKALYARVNVLLPERWKRRLLYAILPGAKTHCGFPAYYDHCTPGEMSRIAERVSLRTVEVKAFYHSPYYSFFFPLYLARLLWTSLHKWLAGDEAAENFILILEKQGD